MAERQRCRTEKYPFSAGNAGILHGAKHGWDRSQAQYPVFVLSLSLKQIVTCNKAASDLFSGISKRKFNLRSIAPGNLEQPLMEASHFALQNKVWAGTLVLKSGSGGFLSSKVRISPCASGSDIVRIALLNIPEAPSEHLCRQPVVENIPFSLREELQKLLSMCNGVDGLMFSDIQSSRGRVEVYGVGEIFSSLPWGDGHAYEGTIAQDIERFGLESLTVEDTLDSIKSIDWAMFIPCGVRSYFALPFYNAEGLHAVLILASKTAGAFGRESEYQYSFLIDPFAKAIAQWRSLGEQKTK